MKKKVFVSCLLVMLLSLFTAALSEAVPERSVPAEDAPMIKKTVPYLMEAGNDLLEKTMDLYFTENGDIPYVSVSDYMVLLTDLKKASDDDVPEYETKFEDGVAVVSRADKPGYTMKVDAEKNRIDFVDFNVFTMLPGSHAVVSLMTMPEGEEIDPDQVYAAMLGITGEQSAETENAESAETEESDAKPVGKLFATTPNYHNRYGREINLDLNRYEIDVIRNGEEIYVPLQTLNDLFVNTMYIQMVYNGETLLAAGYDSNNLKKIPYSVDPSPLSEEMAAFNYHELLLLLDLFYGLREEHGIDDFRTLLEDNTGLVEDLASTDPVRVDMALAKMIDMYCDDLHSGFIAPSYHSGIDSETRIDVGRAINTGISSDTYSEISQIFDLARRKVYGAWVPGYQEVGNTAFITFDSFDSDKAEEEYYELYSEQPPLSPKNTIELMLYADRQIRREGSPVENVVIDLSMNGGGSVDAAVFVISWYLGNAKMALKDTMTGAQSNMTYLCDVNLNGKFQDEEDSLLGQYNLYCLISPLSFSCGNLVPAAFKASECVTLIGQTSGGGTCAVLPATSAAGTLFQLSGNQELSIIKNGSFYNIDQGIEPDVVLTKAASYYDREGLVQMINEMK